MQITTAQLTTYSRLSPYLYKNSSKTSVVIGRDASRKVAPYLHAFIHLIWNENLSNHFICSWDGSSTTFLASNMRFFYSTCCRFLVFYYTHFVAVRVNSMHQSDIGDARSRLSVRAFHATRQHSITFRKACFGQCPASRRIQSPVWRKQNFVQVRPEYTYGHLYTYTLGSPVEIQIPARWSLIGRTITNPQHVVVQQ